jgi:hypothetical protein
MGTSPVGAPSLTGLLFSTYSIVGIVSDLAGLKVSNPWHSSRLSRHAAKPTNACSAAGAHERERHMLDIA